MAQYKSSLLIVNVLVSLNGVTISLGIRPTHHHSFTCSVLNKLLQQYIGLAFRFFYILCSLMFFLF